MIKCITIKDLYRQSEESVSLELPCPAVHVVLSVTDESEDQLGRQLDRLSQELKAESLFLSLQDVNVFQLADPDTVKRLAACERVSRLLEKLGDRPTDTRLILSANSGSDDDRSVGSYEDLFNAAYESMTHLARQAEIRHIMLCIENPAERLFLSPLELRDFIDQINNPYVGVCFNPYYASRLGDPYDWFGILGPRIAAVRMAQIQKEQALLKRFYQYLAEIEFDRPILSDDP